MSDREEAGPSTEVSTRPDEPWWHRHETHVREQRPVRLDLSVRTLGPPVGTHRRQEAILEHVQSLERRGTIDHARVHVWGDSICLSACASSHPDVAAVRDRVVGYHTWGAETPGVSVPFDRRHVDCSVTGERYDVLDLPTLALAVSVDATLECVLPAAFDGEWWTIEHYLEWFERASEERVESLAANGWERVPTGSG